MKINNNNNNINSIENVGNKIIDLNDTYIGIYSSLDGSCGIGLFKKDAVMRNDRCPVAVQYYQDLLSDEIVALALDKNGNDRISDFSKRLSNDPIEMANWNGIRGTISVSDIDFYNLKPITSEIDRGFSLVQFTSVYPNMQGNISCQDIILCLADYCSKFELKEDAKKKIEVSLKRMPQFLKENYSVMPTFINVPINNIDLSFVSKDFNTIKKH